MTTPHADGLPRTATVTRLPGQRPSPTSDVADPSTDGALALAARPWTPDPVETEVRAWAGRFAQAAVEVAAGERPVVQLLRWTGEEVYADLERRSTLIARARGSAKRRVRPQVRSVHACCPGPDTAEVSVLVDHGQRSRAIALRMERHRGRWRCVVLQFV